MQLRTMALQCALTHRAGVPFHPRAEEAEDTAMTDDDDKGVSAATVAGYLGISARAVADLGKRGIAVKAGPGCWRLRESVSRYCDDLRRQAKGKGGESAAAERGRLASAQADLVALRVAKQRGGLLDAREVEREWTDVLRVVRSGMLALPSRVGAQRRSDVHRMTWADVAGDTIRVVQQKTGAKLTIPLHFDLRAILAETKRTHVAILTTEHGRPFTVDGFSGFMRDAIKAAGLPLDCQPHGLRKAAGGRLAEAGCTPHEIMAILGHKTLSEAERYTRQVDQARLASTAITKLEGRATSHRPLAK